MTAPIQGYKLESFVPDALAADSDFHVAMRRRLEDLMRMQGFEQTTRVEIRVVSQGELEDCPLRPGYQIVEAFVDVNEYDLEVPMPVQSGESDEDPVRADVQQQAEPYEAMPAQQDAIIEVPVVELQNGVEIRTEQSKSSEEILGHDRYGH